MQDISLDHDGCYNPDKLIEKFIQHSGQMISPVVYDKIICNIKFV